MSNWTDRLAAGLCGTCGRNPPRPNSKRCATCTKHLAKSDKKRIRTLGDRAIAWRLKQKLLVIGHYSNQSFTCACCGLADFRFLTVDHKDGGGTAHRKSLKIGGNEFYRWLIKNGFPDGYEILCLNCNTGRSLYGICPHKMDITPDGLLVLDYPIMANILFRAKSAQG